MRNFINILRRYKTSSILNILGLATAFLSLYIILVQVNYDLTYNTGIKDYERVYQVEIFDSFSNKYCSWVSRPLAENIIAGSPVVESFGLGVVGELGNGEDYCIDKNGTIEEIKLNISTCSLSWLNVFGYEAIEGNFKDLENLKNAAISQSTAKKYGLKIGDSFYQGFKVDPTKMITVGAIFKDMLADNTDLNQIEVIQNIGENRINDWDEWSFSYFIKLNSTNDVNAFYEHAYKKFREISVQQGESQEEIDKQIERHTIRILPVSKTYFSLDSDGSGRSGNKTTTLILLSIAILVVMIALINFINFFFALVPIRIRYVNTKKIFGCPATVLRLNFILEAIAITITSLLISYICIGIIKSWSIANYISAPLDLGSNLFVLSITIITAIIIALAGSIYPSFYITSFPAAMVIKGSFSATKSGTRLRTILIGLQFTISIGLIISTMLIKSQHNYMMNYDMGFNKEMLLSSYIPNKVVNTLEKRETFSNKLKENPQIKDLAYVDRELIAPSRMCWEMEFKGRNISLQCMPVSWDFIRFIGIKIVEGRDFIREDELKENGTFILNKQASKEYEASLEDKLSWYSPTDIVGICEDFNFKPLQYRVTPFSFYIFGKNGWKMPNHLYLRTTENADIPSVIEHLKNTIMAFSPDSRRDKLYVEFFDQELGKKYEVEQKLITLITLFTILSIIISLMGVFGLVLFETQYRKREIGLRRVHGATIFEILNMFNIKFVKIIVVCFSIAAPLSYFAIERWLGTFAYRTPIHWWIFAIALVIILIITISLVTLRSLKVATDNPVDAIKAE